MFPRSFAAFAASVPLCLLAVSAYAVPGATTPITPQASAPASNATPAGDSAINFTLQEVGGVGSVMSGEKARCIIMARITRSRSGAVVLPPSAISRSRARARSRISPVSINSMALTGQ